MQYNKRYKNLPQTTLIQNIYGFLFVIHLRFDYCIILKGKCIFPECSLFCFLWNSRSFLLEILRFWENWSFKMEWSGNSIINVSIKRNLIECSVYGIDQNESSICVYLHDNIYQVFQTTEINLKNILFRKNIHIYLFDLFTLP